MHIEWGDAGGLIGGGAGVAALVVSWLGNRKAREANRIARGGNALAAGANELSQEANRIALGANELAVEANRLAHHQDQRETEGHDVRWEGDWSGPGQYVLTRRGDHVALDVVARVVVDDEEASERVARVEAGGSIVLDFPRARQTLSRERREYREGQTGYTPSLAFPALPAFADPLHFNMHVIEEWVQWKTELGAPKEHAQEHRLASLGDLE
ncbi:hypothetical protein OG458_40765 [Streptomyces sp. NBC_01281]|uniref:hypothetical protein n=1 Tax=unclassified Streptomyces TaxID=2593676 RepID=UPI002E1373E3|nr:hypothetical protein OG458_40765 [Streptomyces sp. NBC_01281]